MKKLLIVSGVAAAVVIVGSMGIAHSETKSAKKKELIYVSAEQATFKERVRGVSMSVLWGDPGKGAHGTFTKFVPG
jgi:hypothetical protein